MRCLLFRCETLAAVLLALVCSPVFAQSADTGISDGPGDAPSNAVSPNETVNLRSLGQQNADTNVDADAAEAAPRTAGWPATLLSIYCVLIVAASLLGGALPFVMELTHTRMQTMISFVGGLMLGIGVFHLMPHAVHELHSAESAAHWMMVGIVMMFVLLRLFHFHNHEPVTSFVHDGGADCGHDHDHDNAAGHVHEDGHRHASGATGEQHSPAECHTHGHSHGLSWFGIALGLSVHTLIDGLALGASVHAGSTSAAGFQWLGLATFMAVLLHKPLDAVSITSLMAAGGWTKRSMSLVNAGFAMMCPLGAVLFLLGVRQFAGYQQEILGTALAFSAGVFLCIALSDLLPEMEFHSHNKVQLTVALGLGIVLSWGLTFLEQAHLH